MKNIDYELNHKSVEQVTGTKHSKEYMLTVDTAKQVKIASEYVGLVGMKHGGSRANNCLLNYDDIAKSLGVSKSTLKDLLEIDRKLIPQIRELFDNGEGALLEGTLDLSR